MNQQLGQRRAAAAFSGFQMQLFEQQYLMQQQIASQAGGEIEPGSVYEAIDAFYATTSAADQMLSTCQCTECYSHTYKTEEYSGKVMAAQCHRSGLSFVRRMTFDSENDICPDGGFDTPNPALEYSERDSSGRSRRPSSSRSAQ
ncbi:MAG: hypothetical protein R2827_01020 [Bdellovibrionales bacterium]